MSISSYRRNVRAGVTGRNKPTCFPSAFEQISPNHELSTVDYNRYTRKIGTVDKLYKKGGHSKRQINPIIKKLFSATVEPLGCDYDDIEFRRVKNAYNLRRLVASALNQECRVGVDIDIRLRDDTHTVGLRELEDKKFELMSNQVPFGLKVASLDEIFAFMYQPTDPHSTRYPFADANVVILPPS